MTERKPYTCAECEETFTPAWSEEEAAAEYLKNFGEPMTGEAQDVLCEDCYNRFMEWFNKQTPAQKGH